MLLSLSRQFRFFDCRFSLKSLSFKSRSFLIIRYLATQMRSVPIVLIDVDRKRDRSQLKLSGLRTSGSRNRVTQFLLRDCCSLWDV